MRKADTPGAAAAGHHQALKDVFQTAVVVQLQVRCRTGGKPDGESFRVAAPYIDRGRQKLAVLRAVPAAETGCVRLRSGELCSMLSAAHLSPL
jgi:hypothetical protein